MKSLLLFSTADVKAVIAMGIAVGMLVPLSPPLTLSTAFTLVPPLPCALLNISTHTLNVFSFFSFSNAKILTTVVWIPFPQTKTTVYLSDKLILILFYISNMIMDTIVGYNGYNKSRRDLALHKQN